MNILITGVAGAGKTTLASEMVGRDFTAYDMDSIPGLCSWVDLSTGKPEPNFKINSVDDWLGKYDWYWDENKLARMLNENNDAFFCGSSGNQKKFYTSFGKIFLLEMDEQLVRERILENQRDHDYGKKPGEIEAIIDYYEEFQEEVIAAGAIVLNPRRPVDEIVNQVLAECGLPLS